MQHQSSKLLLTVQESYPTSNTDIPAFNQYRGSTAAMVLAIAILISAVTDLIRTLGHFNVKHTNVNQNHD